ncbi:hypothetical protein [Flavobacterium sp. LHD-85]|uniref:hypothetical protein n=1 Tax=Flavobacterium sp. LHD-85 TaxID=3071410 RepID=UPI0027E0571A|nr:hypothetical protein [Flavobacterium sp. LHD-85]MDQ6529515.1 hypothetical protein [Flavobacterium sp. LHD-85]
MNKIKTLIVVLLFINYGFSQVGSEYIFKNDWEKFGLKGNVKTVKTAIKVSNDERWNSNLFYKYNPVLHNYYATDEYDRELYYKKFNTYGMIIERSDKRISNLNEEFEKGQVFKFQIDSVDFFNKQKIASQCNFLFGMNPNRTHTYDDSKEEIKYEYKTENQKITEELYFNDYSSDEFPKEDTLKFDRRTLFFYNPKGQVVKKQIIIPLDQYSSHSTETFYDREIFNDNTLNVNYTYNDQGQITKMTIYKRKEFLYEEIYKIENNKVIEMEKHIDSENTHNEFDSDKVVYKYDDFGNVSSMTSYDNEVGEEILISILFDYTFDSKNNWTLCKMYVNQKNAIPDAVAERKIEYYKN